MSNNNEEIIITAELSEEDLKQIAGGKNLISIKFPTKDGKPDFNGFKGSVGNWRIGTVK
ncbi:hypothetical protein GTQ43_17475 [Nostoc sp. KVJ3]|uniref:hypothetical protein n=1 Tax=Nostoc sp. KVJ3 TaxID=457945 RepID=UPI002238FBE4|nr:hypothetical protein [Nostoc sp. KVJ3]MCW5315534.1 hypothetical protein [Nostoc sp. KVJ3]